MRRKVLSILLCAVLVIVIGCSGQNGGNTNTGSPSGESGANNGGAEAQIVEATFMRGENPVQPVNPDAPILEVIKEKTGVDLKLEPLSGSNYDEKKTALIATNNIPDILGVTSADLQEFGRTGIFVPISDYLDQLPNFQKLIEERPEINKLRVDGKLYGFPQLENYRVGVAPQAMIRTDLLEKHGLEVPTSFDEFYEVLKALKAEYPDSIPFTTRNGTLYMIGQLAYAMGAGGFPGFTGTPVYYEPDQEAYVYGPSTPDFKNVVDYLHRMYDEQLLDADYAVNTKDMAFEKLSSGRALSYYDNNTFAARNFNPALKEIDPDAIIEMIPPLENSEGQVRSYRYQQDWLMENYVISSKVEDPLPLLKMFDWMYSEEGTMVTNFGVQGEHYTMVEGKPVVTSSTLEQFKNQDDVNSSIRSELGLGMLGLAVHIDEQWDADVTDPYMVEMGKQIDEYTEKGEIHFMTYDPPFTEEETDRMKQLGSKVNTKFEQQIDKFIMGARPMSEYDAFAAELVEDGAEEMAQIYNDALSRIQP